MLHSDEKDCHGWIYLPGGLFAAEQPEVLVVLSGVHWVFHVDEIHVSDVSGGQG